MKYLDLFSGIGGFALPLDEAGHSCIGFSEIGKYAIQEYARHFPNHPPLGDITKVDEARLPDFDLIVGGFPCQPFSISGKRGGFEDTRGTLFFDIARIIKAKRPRWAVLENVRGLTNHDGGRTLGTIIQALWELGYAADYKVLNSKDFGVAQNRERVFIVATPEEHCGTIKEFWHFEYPEGHDNTKRLRDILEPNVAEKYFLKPASIKKLIEYKVRNRLKGNGFDAKFHDPDDYMSTLKVGGDGVDNLVQVGVIGKDSEATRVYHPDGIARTLKFGGGMGAKTGLYLIPEATKQGYAVAGEGDAINLKAENSKTRRGRVNDIAHTLDTDVQQYTVQNKRIRRLTPVECARLQGFPDNWCNKLSDTQAYKCYGNAVTTNVIKAIIPRLVN